MCGRPLGRRRRRRRREEPSSEPTLSGLERLYHRVLSWTLERRLVTSGFTLVFFLSVGYPAANLNRVDQGSGAFQTLSVNVLGPLNGPQAQLDSLAREVELRLLKETDELDIKSIVCARGWSPEHLRISLYLTPPAERKLSAEERTKRIKAMLPERSGYRVIMRRGMGDKGDGVNISVYGSYLGMTTQLARELRERLKELPEVKDVQLELPESGLELKLRVDAAWAQIHELTPAWISTSINASLQERQLGEMITAEGMSKLLFAPRTEDLKLYEVGQSVAPMPQALEALSTEQPSVEDRSLDGLVERQLELGSGKIRRKQRRVQVQLNVLGEDGEVMSALERFIPSYSLPIGYGVDYGDRFKNRRRNERGGALAVLMGIALVFCLMGVLFEGLLTPLAILGTIPLAFVGSIWTLWASGTSFEVMAMIGGVILVGVVVNNGIVLIDQIQHLRREGLSRDHAILKASVTRLRPILMTALTTIGGLIPMAFGGGETVGIDYQPLGQVVIGGLASSTLLTLLVVPLLYTLFDDLSEAPREVSARQRSMLKRLRPKRGSS